MARAAQKYLVDKEALEHLIAMIRDGIKSGSSDREIREQSMEILDGEFRAETDQSLKEMKEGKVKRFRSADEMIRDLSR